MASEIGAFRLAVTDHLWVRWSGQRDTWNKKSSISPYASMLTVTDWGEKGAHDKKHPLASAYLRWILLLWVGDFLFSLHHISYWEPGQAYQFCLLPMHYLWDVLSERGQAIFLSSGHIGYIHQWIPIYIIDGRNCLIFHCVTHRINQSLYSWHCSNPVTQQI